MKPRYGKDMADPALLIHGLHLRIQPAFLSEQDGAHGAAVIFPEMPDQKPIPGLPEFIKALPQPVRIFRQDFHLLRPDKYADPLPPVIFPLVKIPWIACTVKSLQFASHMQDIPYLYYIFNCITGIINKDSFFCKFPARRRNGVIFQIKGCNLFFFLDPVYRPCQDDTCLSGCSPLQLRDFYISRAGEEHPKGLYYQK